MTERSEIELLKQEIARLKQEMEAVQTKVKQPEAARQNVVCPDCHNPYDHGQRSPKQLPCNRHTSCMSCAGKSSDQSIVYCTLCRKEYYAKVTELKTNTTILELDSGGSEDATSGIRSRCHKAPIQTSDDFHEVLTDETHHPSCHFHQLLSSDKICMKCFQALCSECAVCHKVCGDNLEDVQDVLAECNEKILECGDDLDSAIEIMTSIREDFNRAMVDLPAQISRVSKDIKDFFISCHKLLKQREQQILEGHKNNSVCTKHRLEKGVEVVEGLIQEMKAKKSEINTLSINRFPNFAKVLAISNTQKLMADAKSLHALTGTVTIPKWRRRRCSMLLEDTANNEDGSLRDTLLLAKDAQDHCLKFFIPKVALYSQDFLQTIKYIGQHCSSNVNPSRSTAHSKYLNLVNNSCVVEVQTYDYKKDKKVTDGDEIIEVVLRRPTGEERHLHDVTNNHNGTYTVRFVPSMCGYYRLFVTIFGQDISNMPLQIKVVENALTNELALTTKEFPQFEEVVDIAADMDNSFVYILEKQSELLKVYQMRLNGLLVRHFFLNETNTGSLQHDERVMISRQFRKGQEILVVLCSKQKKIYILSPIDGRVAQTIDIRMVHTPHAFTADSLRIYVGDYSQQSIFVFGDRDFHDQIRLQAEYVTCDGKATQFKFNTPFPMAVSEDINGDMFVIDQGTNTLHQMDKRGNNMRFISLNVFDLRVEPGIDINSIGIQDIYNFRLGRDGVVVLVTSRGICTLRLFNATIERFYKCDTEKKSCMGLTSNEYVVVNLQECVLYIQQLSFIELDSYLCNC